MSVKTLVISTGILLAMGQAAFAQVPPPYAPPSGGYAPAPQPYYAPPPPPNGGPGYYDPNQPPPPPGAYYGNPRTYKPVRDGLTLGFALGFGAVTFDDGLNTSSSKQSYGGGAGSFYIGAYLTHNLALLFDAEAVSFDADPQSYNGVLVTQAIGAIALKAHLGDRFWVKGGLGYSQLQVDDGVYSASSKPGAAVMVGAGFEVWQRRRASIDLQVNLAAGTYQADKGQAAPTITNAAFLVGFNWF